MLGTDLTYKLNHENSTNLGQTASDGDDTQWIAMLGNCTVGSISTPGWIFTPPLHVAFRGMTGPAL